MTTRELLATGQFHHVKLEAALEDGCPMVKSSISPPALTMCDFPFLGDHLTGVTLKCHRLRWTCSQEKFCEVAFKELKTYLQENPHLEGFTLTHWKVDRVDSHKDWRLPALAEIAMDIQSLWVMMSDGYNTSRMIDLLHCWTLRRINPCHLWP